MQSLQNQFVKEVGPWLYMVYTSSHLT